MNDDLTRNQERRRKLSTRVHRQQKKDSLILTKALSQSTSFLPHHTISELIRFFDVYSVKSVAVGKSYKVDLAILGVIDIDGQLTEFGEDLTYESTKKKEFLLKERGQYFPKIKKMKEVLSEMPNITGKKLVEVLPIDFFPGNVKSTKASYAAKVLSWLK